MPLRTPLHLVVLMLRSSACALIIPAPETSLTVRYFAYGSNLATSVREGRRQLRPLTTEAGLVRDQRLAFNVPGFGPMEPAFASIAPSPGDECHGAVFELGLGDWLRLCLTEGVPTAYRVRKVDVELYGGGRVSAYTLAGGLPLPARMDLPPSPRYLTLIREGARELSLTSAWQERLAAVPTAPFGTEPERQVEDFELQRDAVFV
jgi:gamma-glutamylcyclotransferase